ncbi:MAG TPA: PAS domain S-box protein [Chloroflexota bacterium]
MTDPIEQSENRISAEGADPYRYFFDNARDVFLLIDLSGQILAANGAAREAYGYSDEQLRSMTIHQLRSSDQPALSPAQTEQALSHGMLFETVHRRKDGSQFPVEVSLKGAAVSGRSLLLSIVRDITQRRKTEAALADQELRYRMLFDHLVEALAVHEIILDDAGHPIDYRFLDANPGFEQMTGLKRDEIVGRRVLEVLPGLEQVWIDTYGRVALTGEPIRFQSYSSDLGRHYEVAAFRPAPGQFATLFFDVTAQKAAEAAMQVAAEASAARAAQLQGVLDNMVDAVVVADATGAVTVVNDAAIRLMGLPEEPEQHLRVEEMSELSAARDTHGNLVGAAESPLARALSGDIVQSMDLVIRNARAKKDVHTRSNASPIRGKDGRIIGAVALTRDVTELTALDRLKDQFITVAAHELKTPVAVMKGYAQLLLRYAIDGRTSRREYLEAIDRGADRITRVVEDLLQVSQLQLGQLQITRSSTRLDELVSEAVAVFTRASNDHPVEFEVRARPTVLVDRVLIPQVLHNLLDNSAKYSPAGGDIAVAVDTQGREAIVSIADQGVGIPLERRAHVFDLFFRAHTNTAWDYGGLGIGLYVSKEIVALHGGRIWFESPPAGGTIFYFSLPLEGDL